MKAKDRVAVARPYFERALKDEDVRENVKSAFLTAKDVYNELLGGRGATAVAVRAATDEDIRDRLRDAVEELRAAAQRVQGKEDHTGRNTTLLVVGIVLGLLFNPFTGRQTREWLKDKVFGPEQTFSYEEQSENGGPASPAES
jgi:gas vesicle protein